jgi:hypothetical protein
MNLMYTYTYMQYSLYYICISCSYQCDFTSFIYMYDNLTVDVFSEVAKATCYGLDSRGVGV